ncbi:MAG: hypothetical protein A2Z37_11565 [Chloroflexi bacterium RBG_19FT_COMBO_62_14]|nr:MAG: hypothetical protein A2Z37_11565 [Chloroflexi bacterium RBG_19FT_COMBO_62_14]
MTTGGNGRRTVHSFTTAPRRVVSLVPSMTGSVFDLGLGDHLVGVTDYCLPPEDALGRLARVGGTRSPDISKVIDLKPDLVLANQEENSRQAVEKLEAEGVRVWVTFPKRVDEAIEILWTLSALFRRPSAGAIIRALEASLDWTERAAQAVPRQRVFCPIWQDEHDDLGLWWMTFNDQTYAHDLLARLGADNVFASRVRRYPLAADLGQGDEQTPAERDTRYPRVRLEEVLAAKPEIILLPTEPFPFTEREVERVRTVLGSTPAVLNNRVYLVDGSLITWHGTRLGMALRELPGLLQPITGL